MVRSLASLLLILATIINVQSAYADPVYRWEAADGSIHYSSEPPSKNAEPADLPRITRGRLGLAPRVMETCDKRGGVNCQAGADLDGSVICTDGYKEVKTPYRFYCNSPKLTLNDVSEIRKDGQFSILVRNSKSVAAKNPEVIIKVKDLASGVIIKGPGTIAPFEVGEFIYDPEKYGRMAKKPLPEDITLTCYNCEN